MKHACREISRLASDSLDRPLSLWEKLRFKVHLSMCGNCRNCNENMRIIHKATELMQQTDFGNIRLNDGQRQHLHDVLDQKTNN